MEVGEREIIYLSLHCRGYGGGGEGDYIPIPTLSPPG